MRMLPLLGAGPHRRSQALPTAGSSTSAPSSLVVPHQPPPCSCRCYQAGRDRRDVVNKWRHSAPARTQHAIIHTACVAITYMQAHPELAIWHNGGVNQTSGIAPVNRGSSLKTAYSDPLGRRDCQQLCRRQDALPGLSVFSCTRSISLVTVVDHVPFGLPQKSAHCTLSYKLLLANRYGINHHWNWMPYLSEHNSKKCNEQFIFTF